jgi:hypothetical protein
MDCVRTHNCVSSVLDDGEPVPERPGAIRVSPGPPPDPDGCYQQPRRVHIIVIFGKSPGCPGAAAHAIAIRRGQLFVAAKSGSASDSPVARDQSALGAKPTADRARQSPDPRGRPRRVRQSLPSAGYFRLAPRFPLAASSPSSFSSSGLIGAGGMPPIGSGSAMYSNGASFHGPRASSP